MTKKELIAKAKEANSAEELLALAKELSIELTEEQAKEYYDRLHATGELADDELDNVAGGGCNIGETIEQAADRFHMEPREGFNWV